MDAREQFLAKMREERMVRADHKFIVLVQANIRGNAARRAFRERIKNDLDRLLGISEERQAPPTNIELLKYGFLLPFLENEPAYYSLMGAYARFLATSLSLSSTNHTFAALFCSPSHIKRATYLVQKLFQLAPPILGKGDFEQVAHARCMNSLITFLLVFSSANNWSLSQANPSLLPILNNLCNKFTVNILNVDVIQNFHLFLIKAMKRGKLSLSTDIINAVFTIIFRVLLKVSIEDDKIELLLKYVYTCPGVILALNSNTYSLIQSSKILEKTILYLSTNVGFLEKMNAIETLNILANLINMSYREHDILIENLLEWTGVVNNFFNRIQQTTAGGKQKKNWHPILGWICEGTQLSNEHSNKAVRQQLQYFWSKQMVKCLFGRVLGSIEGSSAMQNKLQKLPQDAGKLSRDLVQKLLKKLSVKEPEPLGPIGPVSLTAVVCRMYQNALLTFNNIHVDIVAGLCQDDSILTQLWDFISQKPVENLIRLFANDPKASIPHFAPVSLFGEVALSLISILDEQEIYEQETPFSLQQLRQIASFGNTFCYRAIWEGIVDFEHERAQALFQSLYQLTMLLHNKDVRRAFTDLSDFWQVTAPITTEFEKQNNRALVLMEKMPHLVALKQRMILFRKLVNGDKVKAHHHQMTVGTISRNNLIDDGFRLFSNISNKELKSGLRIKFVNKHGVEEIGIDQDGVFKEFLELTVKGVFDPNLNLFKVTQSGQFYPSHTSYIHPNHLEYFTYVGRMLAKSVYDGFVVDIQLAPVLLANILGKQLCAFDELATLDPELYKSLTYVKHYKDTDDVADLELTFSVDEEFLGQIKTVDLLPSGRSIKVTNENKILYIHTMANHRVLKQTKQQREAFVNGFRSIIAPKWLSLFSTHELQMLIAGTSNDIDVEDLKKHTAYFGGFHGKHRVIKWFWQIVEDDFTPAERKLLLKFVTSSSRGPLLGFTNLEPPFSIRCVEVGDDQDQGDTLGSVVRGFLNLKKNSRSSARLPTSSTCFNLLKLPNYSKKSILLEKLRYAINANAGFELS